MHKINNFILTTATSYLIAIQQEKINSLNYSQELTFIFLYFI